MEQQIIEAALNSITKAGLVQLEVSARHVHLSQADLEFLFGKQASLTPKRELSQIGQFLSEERIDLVGPKGKKSNVAILGPLRKDTQIELSKSDCVELGIKAPLRESGDVRNSAPVTLIGPCGTLELKEGAIVAHKHVHVPTAIAEELHFKDHDRVAVQVFSDRPTIYQNVIIRVSDQFRYRMHVDFDEANAAEIHGFTFGKIMR